MIRGAAREGLAAIERSAELDPRAPGLLVNLSRALIAVGRVADAEEPLRGALSKDPRNLDILQNLGESLRIQERYEEALAVYAQIIERRTVP